MTIEDEAFEATAAMTVIFSDSLVRIGERAFAYSSRLREIVIPESVAYIGDSALEGVSGLVIRGAVDSYAARWASEHDIAFTPINTVQTWIKTLVQMLGVSPVALLPVYACPAITNRRRRTVLDAWRSMRPQDRPELYPIDYRFP